MVWPRVCQIEHCHFKANTGSSKYDMTIICLWAVEVIWNHSGHDQKGSISLPQIIDKWWSYQIVKSLYWSQSGNVPFDIPGQTMIQTLWSYCGHFSSCLLNSEMTAVWPYLEHGLTRYVKCNISISRSNFVCKHLLWPACVYDIEGIFWN